MKLLLSIADAALKSEHGTWSVLGLGISRLHVESFPTGFTGALVLFATPEVGDSVEEGADFSIETQSRGGEWESVTTGRFGRMRAQDQSVFAFKIGLLVPEPGVYAYRLVSGNATAETHFIAVPKQGSLHEKTKP